MADRQTTDRPDSATRDVAAAYDADVIILSWNRTDDTIAAVMSAARQDGVDHRVKIVDQGSSPDNLARLRAAVAGLPNAELLELGRNLGVPGGRNAAASLGRGRHIVALDSDAEFADRDTLRRAVERMDGDPALGAIGFRIVTFDEGGDDLGSWDYPNPVEADAGRSFTTTRFIGAGHAIRRTAFDRVGGYDESLFFCGEELDLSYRILNLGLTIEYRPEIVVRHKVSPEHRVNWSGKRFEYTVRNNLYSQFKYGASPARLLVSAAAFCVRGMNNGLPLPAARGVAGTFGLAWRHVRSGTNKDSYRLTERTRAYIRRYEFKDNDSFQSRVRRLGVKLPGQA